MHVCVPVSDAHHTHRGSKFHNERKQVAMPSRPPIYKDAAKIMLHLQIPPLPMLLHADTRGLEAQTADLNPSATAAAVLLCIQTMQPHLCAVQTAAESCKQHARILLQTCSNTENTFPSTPLQQRCCPPAWVVPSLGLVY